MPLRPLFMAVFVFGFALLAYSWTLPYYHDPEAKSRLDGRAASWSGEKREKAYYPVVARLRTAKTTWMDVGAGLAIAAGSLWILFLATGVRTTDDLTRLHSPNRPTLWLTTNLVWLLQLPGTSWYYSFRRRRGDYPWFADSIGLGIGFDSAVVLLLLVPLNLFLLISLRKGHWPTPLFVRPATYTRAARIEEAFWLGCLIYNQIVLVGYVCVGDHVAILVNLFFTYVLLSLRAGRMQRYGVKASG